MIGLNEILKLQKMISQGRINNYPDLNELGEVNCIN